MVLSLTQPSLPIGMRRGSGHPCLSALTLLCFLSILFCARSLPAQSRPTIQWIRGGHFGQAQAALSPDGATLATLGSDGTVKLRRTSDGITLRTLFDTAGISRMVALAFSPDGTQLAVGSVNSTYVQIYRVSDGAPLRSWQYTKEISTLAWSPDGAQIAIALLGDSSIKLVNASTGALLRTLTGHTSAVEMVAFSGNSARLVSGGDDKTLRIWNTADGSLQQTISSFAQTVYRVAFSPDNHTVASGDGTAVIQLWDADSGSLLHSLNPSTDPAAGNPIFSPDGATIAIGTADSHIQTWHVADGTLAADALLGPVAASATPVAFSSDGTQLLATGSYPEYTYYNSGDLSVARSLPTEFSNAVTGVGVTPDSAHVIAAGGSDPYLRVWGASTGTLEMSIPNPGAHNYQFLAVSPDGASFATTDTQQTLRIWRVSDGTLLVDKNIGVSAPMIAWSSDSQKIFYPDAGSTITIASAADGSKIGSLTGGPASTRAIAASPDGKLLAAAGVDKVIKVWRLSDSSLLFTLTGHTDIVNGLAFSPDSAKLLSGGADRLAILWNVATGAKIYTLSSGFGVTSVAYAPDGASFAAATLNHLVFWRVADGTSFNDFTDEAQNISAGTLIYAPNNMSLYYGRVDATAVAIGNPYLNPFLAELTLSPSSVVGGQDATGTITLTKPAPTGGILFSLSSSQGGVATIPTQNLLIPAGATTASFTIHTISNSYSAGSVITAANSGYSASATLTVRAHLASDFNGDGRADLLFQSQNSNAIVAWFTNGLNILGGSTISSLPEPGWQVVGAADIHRDAHSDLVLQNQTTGKIVLWYLTGTNVTSGEAVSIQPVSGYRVVGVGDYNGDGFTDLLFQQDGTGQLVIWYLQGSGKVIGGISIPQIPTAGYKVVGTGDLDGDGKLDIVFQNQTTNQLMVWYMNGTQFLSQASIAYLPPTAWKVRAVADINGDGKADLVFQNQDTNQLDVWYMDGVTITGGGFMSLVPLKEYKLLGPH